MKKDIYIIKFDDLLTPINDNKITRAYRLKVTSSPIDLGKKLFNKITRGNWLTKHLYEGASSR